MLPKYFSIYFSQIHHTVFLKIQAFSQIHFFRSQIHFLALFFPNKFKREKILNFKEALQYKFGLKYGSIFQFWS